MKNNKNGHNPARSDLINRIDNAGIARTKRQLMAIIPGICFSGKNKAVYFDGNSVNFIQISHIGSFCDATGYRSVNR